MGQKLSNFNELVTNQIWSLIENEDTLQNAGLKGDLFSIEKTQMKQDAEFLSKILSFDENGKMSVKLEQNDYKQFFKMLKGNEYLSNTSSEVSSQQDSDQIKSEQSSQKYQYRFKKLGDDRVSISSCNLLETSNGLLKNDTVVSYDGSVNDELEPSLTLEPRRGS